MEALVKSVDARVEIIFRDGQTVTLHAYRSMVPPSIINFIKEIRVQEKFSIDTINPVGSLSSNHLVLRLVSRDQSLVAENENSPYFGLMDKTAIIKLTLIESGEEIPFGTWYVDRWYSDITNENRTGVTIEAYDLLYVIKDNKVPDIYVGSEEIGTKQFLINLIDKYNENAVGAQRIEYNPDDINFDAFPFIRYWNLDMKNMLSCLNMLSQSTLTYFIWDRENKLRTDYAGDDTPKEKVCDLSDMVNITKVRLLSGPIANYDGVRVNYSFGTINNMSKLADITDQKLISGINYINDITFSSPLYKINQVIVTTDNPHVTLTVESIKYNKDGMNLAIFCNDDDVDCSIEVYGQTINNSNMSIEKYLPGGQNQLFIINNHILPARYIDAFASKLLDIISLKYSRLAVAGFFNPRIKLGDTVFVDVQKSTNVPPGYYKVVGLDWLITGSIKCNAELLKLINDA